MRNKEKLLLNDFAIKIAEKKLSVPAIFFLESTKYLSFIGSQILIFFGPIITSFSNSKKYYKIVNILEKRSNIEFLINKIESHQLEIQNKSI